MILHTGVYYMWHNIFLQEGKVVMELITWGVMKDVECYDPAKTVYFRSYEVC